jgi:hypothetical protein
MHLCLSCCQVLKGARIVGMTTTGLAGKQGLLHALQPKARDGLQLHHVQYNNGNNSSSCCLSTAATCMSCCLLTLKYVFDIAN